MEFQIDSASRMPIYRQLVAQIREAVARGRLAPEERLPSVRDLSRQLVINPNTVARVYTELEREGVLNTRPGLGVFVAQPRTDLTKRARKDRLICAGRWAADRGGAPGLSGEEVLALVSERMASFSSRKRWGASK